MRRDSVGKGHVCGCFDFLKSRLSVAHMEYESSFSFINQMDLHRNHHGCIAVCCFKRSFLVH